MDKQKVYNEIKAHLLSQNEKSGGKPETPYQGQICAYRGRKGLKCAIGALFPDSLYHKDMDAEGLGVSDLIVNYPEVAKHLKAEYGVNSKEDRAFLSRFQSLHDRHQPEDWPFHLGEVAELEGLDA